MLKKVNGIVLNLDNLAEQQIRKRGYKMEYLTAEKINELTENLNGIGNIKAINRLYRKQDESSLWPIKNRFNVTERAIRKARQFDAVYGLEYCYLLESIISEIVNNRENW